jgi:hypothetical protein
MEKLTENQRKDIIQLCSIDNTKENIKKVANDYNVTERYVYKLLSKNKRGEIDNNILSNKSEFTKKADKIMDLAFSRLEEKLNSTDEKTTIQSLATLIGILYDKSRLENNLSTNNSSININIKVEK